MKRFLSVLTILLLIGFQATAQFRIYTPTMKAPENGAVGRMPNALLDWDAVTGQGTEILYEVQLATSEDFSDAITFADLEVTALTTSELVFAQTYFWRVRASDGIATSEWSTPWSFTVVKTVTITKPDNASLQNPDPLLKWNKITGINQYEVQVDTAYSWRVEASGQTKELNDVFVVDESNSYAVGAAGTILKHDGTNWTPMDSPVTVDLFSIYFTDATNGWASGANGTLLQFDGTTWSEVASGVNQDLNGLFFLSATEGYAAGNGGTVLKFDGSAWTGIDVGITDNLNAVHGLDANNLVVVGKSGKNAIYDGTSWTSYNSGSRDMLGVWMLAPNEIWAPAKSGRFYGFNGTEWIEQSIGTKDFRDVFFLDNETGFMVGRTGVLIAYDGTVWAPAASGSGKDLNGIYLLNESKGYIVGNEGVVVTYQGDGFNSPYLKNFMIGADEVEYRLSKLAFGKNHYFRMRAKHSQATSEWSGANAFSVIARPVLKTPADNTSNTQLDLILTWEKITGIVKYNVQLSTTEDFADPLLFETGVEEYEIDNLTFGMTYYWRVDARHGGGTSDWSEVNSFTTLNCVSLTAPANNATEITRLPRYEWTEISGVEKYMVEVDKSPDFTNPEIKIAESNTYQQMFLLEKEVQYFWRVRAIQGLDTTDWCAAWSFTTKGETSIGEQNGNEFKIYPNPASDQFQVYFEAGNNRNATIEIYNMIGSKVYTKSIAALAGQNSEIIDVSEIKAGMYFIKLQMNDKAYTKRLVIE